MGVVVGGVVHVRGRWVERQRGDPGLAERGGQARGRRIFQRADVGGMGPQVIPRDLRRAREVTITRNETGWQISKPETKPADAPQVDSTLTQLTTLQATRVLTNVTDLKPYGLVTATLEVRLVMSDTTAYAITVGDKTPDGSSYYAVYTGDKSKVFLLSSSVVDNLEAWLNTPPYEPTPTATATATPPVTPTNFTIAAFVV